MKQAVCAVLLAGMFLLPAMPAAAKPLDASSTELEIALRNSSFLLTIKVWFDRFNGWLEQVIGIDLYRLATIVFDFSVLVLKLTANLFWQVIAQLREVLGL